jgi:geranylgeranyl diphosphate synthase, type II
LNLASNKETENQILIQNITQNINKELHSLVKLIPEEILAEPYRYLIDGGGKRIRSLITTIVTGIFTNEYQTAINAAISLEVLHNFTLVHDDIMDNSPIRRGRATIHTKWDSSIAILLGDIMIGLANEMILKSPNTINVLKYYNKSLIEVCRGQALDMSFNNLQFVNSDKYFEMIYLKTGSLLQNSFVIGGLVANCSEENLNQLENIGKYVGLAFQLQDDLLDLIGNEDEIGKKVGNDLVEGKKTFMMIRAKEIVLENDRVFNDNGNFNYKDTISEDDKLLITNFYNNNGVRFDEVETIKSILYKVNIIEEVNFKINDLFSKTNLILNKFENNIYKETLRIVLTQLLNRQF